MVVPAGAEHLGGYIEGGDEATYFPALWEWLVSVCGVRTVLDIGCGDGVALRYFRKLGCRVEGVDGVEQTDHRIHQHDYTTGPYMVMRSHYDLIWCCEVVEHIEEQYLPNLIEDFKRGKMVLMTHAFPGQPGHHHVNCRDAEYWKGVMAGAGFKYQEALTNATRWTAQKNESPWNHYARSGLAFRRYTGP